MVPHASPSGKGLVFWTVFLVWMISCNGVESDETSTYFEYTASDYTTSTGFTEIVTTETPIENPSEVKITHTTNESLSVDWKSTKDSLYKVHCENASITDPYTNGTNFTLVALKSGGKYYVTVVECRNESDCNSESTTASAMGITNPNEPLNLKVNVSKDNKFTISWARGDSIEDTNYTVLVTPDGNATQKHETNGTSFTTDELSSNTKYEVKVFSSVIASPSPTSENTTETTYTYPDPVKMIDNKTGTDWVYFSWRNSSAENHVLFVFDVDDNDKCISKVYYNNTGLITPKNCSGECNKYSIGRGADYNISWVEPCGNYYAKLYAVNEVGCSNETKVPVKTLPAEPGDKITNLTISDVTATSMNVSWSSISNSTRCPMTYSVNYTYINCSSNEEENWSSPYEGVNSRVVDGLKPYTNHTFTVMARTSSDGGPGNSTSESERGETSEDVPGKPSAIQYHESNGTLEWDILECERNGVILNYRVNYSCQESDRPEGPIESKEIVVEDQPLNVNFKAFRTCNVTIEASTIVGYGDPAYYSYTTNETIPGKVNFNFTVVTNNSILVIWDEPDERNGAIVSYRVEWGKSDGSDGKRDVNNLTETDLSYTIEHLTPFTNYTVAVYASTAAGEGESDRLMIATETGYAVAVTNVTAKFDENDHLKLDISWSNPPLVGDTDYLVCVSEEEEQQTNAVSDDENCQFSEIVSENNTVIAVKTYYWNHTIKVTTRVKQNNGDLDTSSSGVVTERTGKAAPGQVSGFERDDSYTNRDCRKVKFKWEKLEPKKVNGIFKNYTIFIEGDGVYETSNTNYSHTEEILPLEGGKKYIGAISAWNDFGTGDPTKTEEFETRSCAPTIQGSGAGLVNESGDYRDDPQKTINITYNNSLFNDESFGELQERGFVVLDLTDKNARSSDSSKNFTNENFHLEYIAKWKEYSEGVKDYYKIIMDPGSYNENNYLLGGNQSPCIKEYCNGKLKPGKKYKIQMFSCTDGGCLVTADANDQDLVTDPPTDNTPAIVAGVIVPVAFMIFLVSGAVFYRRNLGNKQARPVGSGGTRGTANPAFELKESQPSGALYKMKKIARMRKMRKRRSKPVLLSKFQEKVHELHRDSDLKFSEEYKLVKEIAPKNPWHAAEFPENRPKNRFTNILPFDHSRVKLLPVEDEDSGDYINANYMPGYNSKREFIAAQGPLPGTKDDFWRMIWEQNVHTIIMLTRCLERGRPKCDQYWPTDSGEPIYYGDLGCELKSESTLHNYTIRVFEVTVGDKERLIKQMHFTTWPDHGCPESTDDLLSFVQHVRQHVPYRVPNQGPILVHCSAGVGRTGTWICVDRLLQHIKEHDEVDIFGVVLEMRHYRCNMVQTEDQYIYIHDCIEDAIQRGMHESAVCYIDRAGPEGEEDEANLYENVEVKANGAANQA